MLTAFTIVKFSHQGPSAVKRWYIVFAWIPILVVSSWAIAQPETLSGRVLRIEGPDTLIVEGPGGVQYPVSPSGVDAGDVGHAAGARAHDRLEESLVGRHVTVTNMQPGGAGVYRGVINYGRQDMNRQWIEEGLFPYDGDSAPSDQQEKYMTAEELARAAEKGVWRPMEPGVQPPSDKSTVNPPPGGPGFIEAVPPPGGWQFRPLESR
jgi:endonuclease YncB( thermonuclease family)